MPPSVFSTAFEAAFERLAEFPAMGHARPDLIDLPVRF